MKKARSKPVYITTRSFKHYSPVDFNSDVSLAPWSLVDVFDDVEDKLSAFDLLFNEILGRHAPVKTFKARGKLNPCVTDNIRGLMKTIGTIGVRTQRKQTTRYLGLPTDISDRR